MVKVQIQEAIVVEGRYDKNALSQVVDTLILETDGFGIFKNQPKMKLLGQVAQKRGLIVLTDSDGAGFVIRNRIKGEIPPQYVKHAYIPDQYGKEKRKRKGGKEGKLGVEGMSPEILQQVLKRAGATFLGEPQEKHPAGQALSKTDLYMAGLVGGANSHEKRVQFLHALQLPEHMSANALLDLLNTFYTPQEAKELLGLEKT